VRLWSIHPKYLDPQGLVALWREGLLAQKVLAGQTRGYQHHPQLDRFRSTKDPAIAIAAYLGAVHREACRRGYSFDSSKLPAARSHARLVATDGQILLEWAHLKSKLRSRSPAVYSLVRDIERPQPHPLFRIVPGPVAAWERRIGEDISNPEGDVDA
jgi:pyrimidine dimer DNA glycosylase